MTTLKVDSQRRIRLGDAKPGQVYARENGPDGSIVLTPVKAERAEAFPEGSLAKYFEGKLGRERDERDRAIGSACVQGPE